MQKEFKNNKMENSVSCKWNDELSFNIDIDGHTIKIDSSEDMGGNNYGTTPKPLILASLAGCTSIDVVAILKKMRIQFDDFSVNATGELSDETPRVYKKIHLTYKFKGDNLNPDQLEKAIKLSQDKYCGVSKMLREVLDISYEIKIY